MLISMRLLLSLLLLPAAVLPLSILPIPLLLLFLLQHVLLSQELGLERVLLWSYRCTGLILRTLATGCFIKGAVATC
jgi:hypothetical protein